MTTLVLFDIDGTLLSADGAGVRAMQEAARETIDQRFSFEGISFAGGLDPLIVDEAARRSGLNVTPADYARFKRVYGRRLGELLSSEEHLARALPGALSMVQELADRNDVVLGLLTGNYAETAELKLRHVGFDFELFVVRAFGDLAPSRPELVGVARQQHHTARGEHPKRSIIVGDTPRDVECALVNGIEILAVATGHYGCDELRAAGATVVVENLADPAPLLALLDRI